MNSKDIGNQAFLVLFIIASTSFLIGLLWGFAGDGTGTPSLLLASGIGMFFLLYLHHKIFPEPTIANLLIFILSGVVIVCLLNILEAQEIRVDVTLEYYGLLLLLPIGALIYYEYQTDIKTHFLNSGLSLNSNLSFSGHLNQTILYIDIEDNKGKYLIINLNKQRIILEKIDSEYVSRSLFIEALNKDGVLCVAYEKLKKQLTLIIKDSTGSVLDIVDCNRISIKK